MGTGASNRLRALAGLLIAAALLVPSVASAQVDDAPPPRPPRATEALRAAQESYRRGDYESAAMFYQEADATKQQLTPRQQADLADLIKANNIALEASRNGAVRLRMAADASKRGDLPEAAALVRAESANQYLKPADKALLGQLTEQLRAKGVAGLAGTPSKGPAPVDASKEDYGTLVQMARSAYQRGDYDAAEWYCKQAEKKAGRLPDWVTPWNDSYSKVSRDVQNARLKQAALAREQQQNSGPELKPDQPSMLTAGLNKVRSLFGPGSASPAVLPSLPAAGEADNGGPPLSTDKTDKNVVAGPAATSRAQQPQQIVSKETLEARMFRDQAIEALKRNDLVAAKKYAEQAKAKMDPNSWWESPTPDELLRDINRHLGQFVPANGTSGDFGPSKSGGLPPAVDAGNARTRLKEARALYAQGQLDEAECLCAQVAAVKVAWGLFEDNPDKLRADINSARQKADKAESVKLLIEARKALAAGNSQEARAKAWKAKQLHGPYNMWDLGDRPDKLLADIDAAEAKQKMQGTTGEKSVANSQNQANFGPLGPRMGSDAAPAPVSVAAMTAKQRAQVLLEEARALQRQDKLAEAYAKASEARIAAAAAYKAGLAFGPGEESPDLFLYALAGHAKTRIESLVRVAGDITSAAANDAFRLKKAADSLAEARQLAVLFGLDVTPLDIKLSLVMQRQSNPSGVMPAAAQQPSENSMGLKLLDDARAEIRAGRLEQARKFAEEAMDAKYAVQKQAAEVLRGIEIEVIERMRLDADRAFTNAHEAFVRGDYRQARTILANVDERLLSPRNQASLRELAMHPEMQMQPTSAPIKLTGGAIDVQGPGMANVTDLPTAAGKAGNDEFALLNALNKVEFDKLTKEGLAAQRSAMQRAEAGDLDGAIETLRAYNVNLSSSGLEPEQVAVLQKPVDRYVQQYQTRKAQKLFQDAQGAQEGGRQREKTRTLHEQETQAEIVKLSDQAKQLMQDGKFNEAQVIWLKVQDLDPDNLAAHAGIFETRIQIQEKRNALADRHQREYFLDGINPDPGPLVTSTNPAVLNPETWSHTRERKGQTYVKSELKDPVEKIIERALLERKVTLSFDNVPLYNCIQAIKDYLGNINVVPDDQAIQSAGIHMDQPVTLNVTDMNLQSALNILLKKVGLTYVIQNQSITITTEDNARGKLQRIVYSVADLVKPVPSQGSQQVDLLKAHWQRAINDELGSGLGNYGGPTPYAGPGGLPPGQPVSGLNGAYGPGRANALTGRAPKLENDQDMDELLIRLITTTIVPETWSDVGGKGTIQYYPLGLALIVNQTPDIQEQIIDLLTALRRLQDLEVAIEMKLVSVSEAFYEFMGVNFNMNLPTGNSAGNVQTLTSGNFQQNGLINTFHPSTPVISGLTPAGTLTPDLGVPISTSSFGFALPPFGGYPGTLGADGGLSLGLAFLSDIQVSMFMEAVQGDRRSNTMQAPKLTVFNGQTANINVGDDLYFLTQINVIQVNGQMVFQPQQTPSFYGVAMTVTPVVSADRRFVRLNLNPTLSNLVSATVPLLPVQQIVPQLLYDNVSPPQPTVFTMFFQQPARSTISLNTTVVVPDGGTVLMGGLKTLVEGRNEAGPPILSKIPYLSRLFTNVGYGREAQSLMIMVTARIIINEEEELEFLGQVPRIPR